MCLWFAIVDDVTSRDWRLRLQVSTLRFATRMMCVASEPALNEHYDPAVGYAPRSLAPSLPRSCQQLLLLQ